MDAITLTFKDERELQAFIMKPGSFTLGDLTRWTQKPTQSPIMVAMVERLRASQSVTAKQLVAHALKVCGFRRSKRNVATCYRYLKRLVDDGRTKRLRKGLYTLHS